MEASNRLFMPAVELHRMRKTIEEALAYCEKDDPLAVEEKLYLLHANLVRLQRDIRDPVRQEWVRFGIQDYKQRLEDKTYEQSSDSR